MASTVCGWCDTFAKVDLVGPARFTASPTSADEDAAALVGSFTCQACGMHSIAWVEVNVNEIRDANATAILTSPEANDFGHLDIAWIPSPGARARYPDVPSHIAGTATEAHACLTLPANRAAMVLARAVIEATAKDKAVVKGTLAAKIDALTSAGHIRPAVAEAAHEVRHLGNDSAHGDFTEPVESADAEAAVAIMGEILAEVYQGPARVERLRARRQAKAQDSRVPAG